MVTQEEIVIFVVLFAFMLCLILFFILVASCQQVIQTVYATPDEDEELIMAESGMVDSDAINWKEACTQLYLALFKKGVS